MCLSCYSECISTPDKVKNLPDHSGRQTFQLLRTPVWDIDSIENCVTAHALFHLKNGRKSKQVSNQ